MFMTIYPFRESDEDLMAMSESESHGDHTPGDHTPGDHTPGIVHLSANASSDFIRVLREIQQTSG